MRQSREPGLGVFGRLVMVVGFVALGSLFAVRGAESNDWTYVALGATGAACGLVAALGDLVIRRR